MAHDFKNFPELTNSQMEIYYFESPHKQITSDFDAKVVKVIDGDTIRVFWEERDFDFPVRLLDIDAPEIDTPRGVKSQKWLEDLILGKDILVQIDEKQRVDKWGRLLGKIISEGLPINELSMLLGFSIPFERREENALT